MPAHTLALVLFVKNEAVDIMSWLAWHAAMGCKTFIIYDDHSQDGTWEVINYASRHLDIRAARTDLATNLFTERQKLSYLDAFARYGAEFEWLAFIDSDEFLSTEHNKPLPEFLDSFPDAHAVAVNWCNYGSSGHALRPTVPIVEAFVWHSSKTSPINRHVKSFVRCSKFRGRFWNVHYFDVDDEYYVDSIGRRIDWSPTRGIVANAPDWFAAKIMHFQCRSMEHFINRLKLRPDVLASTETWRHYDMNDVEDVRFRSLLGAFHRHYAAIGRIIDIETIRTLHHVRPSGIGPRQVVDSEPGTVVPPDKPAAFLVRTWHETYLSCGDQDHLVRHRPMVEIDGRDIRPVILVVPPAAQDIGVIVLAQEGAWLDHETRRGPLLIYEIRQMDAGMVALAAPRTGKLMCAIPGADRRGIGEILVNRSQPGEWERMVLVPLDGTPFASTEVPLLPSLPKVISDARHVLNWIQTVEPEVAAPAFNMLVQALSPMDRQMIEACHDVILRI